MDILLRSLQDDPCHLHFTPIHAGKRQCATSVCSVFTASEAGWAKVHVYGQMCEVVFEGRNGCVEKCSLSLFQPTLHTQDITTICHVHVNPGECAASASPMTQFGSYL